MAPHLRGTVAVHTRLAEAEGDLRALAEALERLPRAAFLVDGAVTVRHANAAGAALLAAWGGGPRAAPGEGGALRAARTIPRAAGMSACPAPRPDRRSP